MQSQQNKSEAKTRGRSPAEQSELYKGNIQAYNHKKMASISVQFINETNIYFITINPYKKAKSFRRLQKIGPISDWLRKKAIKFYLVQESNEDGTKHYHALAKLKESHEKKPLIFKNANMQVDRVGGPAGVPQVPERGMLPPKSTEDKKNDQFKFIVRMLYWELGRYTKAEFINNTATLLVHIWDEQRLARNRNKIKVKKLNKLSSVNRIINYMVKETTWTRYLDYMYHNIT